MDFLTDKDLWDCLKKTLHIERVQADKCNEWLKASSTSEKGRLTAEFYELLSFRPSHESSWDFFWNKLIDRIAKYEELIGLTRAGISGLFYRDHLNHMVRTLFLAFALVAKLRAKTGVTLERLNLKTLLTACLLHDLAYPVQEAKTIHGAIADSMNETYSSIKVAKPYIEFCNKPVAQSFLKELAEFNDAHHLIDNQVQDLLHILTQEFLKLNHGVLASLETRLAIEESVASDEAIKRALLAIALHDIKDIHVNINQFPELYLLILSDALQDWGRPILHRSGKCMTTSDQIGVEIEPTNDGKARLGFALRYITKVPGLNWAETVRDKDRLLKRLEAPDVRIEVSLILPPSHLGLCLLELKRDRSEHRWCMRFTSAEENALKQLGYAADRMQMDLYEEEIWDIVEVLDFVAEHSRGDEKATAALLEVLSYLLSLGAEKLYKYGPDWVSFNDFLIKHFEAIKADADRKQLRKVLVQSQTIIDNMLSSHGIHADTLKGDDISEALSGLPCADPQHYSYHVATSLFRYRCRIGRLLKLLDKN